MKKGIYLYKYMDSFERFREAKLPAKKAFYTKLHDKKISEEEYEHAQQAREAFGHNIGDYHDLYLYNRRVAVRRCSQEL